MCESRNQAAFPQSLKPFPGSGRLAELAKGERQDESISRGIAIGLHRLGTERISPSP
jgi:hypothetical protein